MPSSSKKQHNFMAAIAHSPSFAKKVGVKQSVGKDFAAADKGKTFARGGVTQQKINKQNTRHGMMDLPVANLNRFAGMKKGGIMKKRRFGSGGDTGDQDMENAGYDKSGEGEDAVYRKSFSGGVKAGDETPAPKKTAAEPVRSEPVRRTNEIESGPPEDTRGVSGMASRKYVSKLTDQQKSDNADRLAKEAALIAATGGAGTVARGVYRVGQAANKARKLGLEKGNAAATGEGAAWGGFSSSAATRGQNLRNRYRDSEKTIKKNPDGYKKGGMMKESKDMTGKEVAFMKKKGAPASMIKHEKAEMGMAKGGSTGRPDPRMLAAMMAQRAAGSQPMRKPQPDGMAPPMASQSPMGMKKGGGIESRGKTKGTVIRMAAGGSVSSASRRADGIAQRGKTRC